MKVSDKQAKVLTRANFGKTFRKHWTPEKSERATVASLVKKRLIEKALGHDNEYFLTPGERDMLRQVEQTS